MKSLKKGLFATTAVILGCAAVIGGVVWRNRIDLGRAELVTTRLQGEDNLLASTSQDGANYPEESFYEQLVDILKRYYIEPVEDDTKLALGTVKGMIGLLADPNCVYMDANQFRVYKNAVSGKLEGIGVVLQLEVAKKDGKQAKLTADDEQVMPGDADAEAIPVLKVVAVAPGGPADRAGVKIGDWVTQIDGHDVFSPTLVREFRSARALVEKGKISGEKMLKMSEDLQQKADTMIMPNRAKEKLTLGETGTVKVVFNRGGTLVQSTVEKGTSTLPGWLHNADGSIVLRFQPGISERLSELVSGSRTLTLDLRNPGIGSMDEMRRCLELLAPAGTYGQFANQRSEKPVPFAIKTGNSNPPQITLLVDGTTSGVAEIFALALSSSGGAQLKGPKTANGLELIEVVSLPDGAGYTLVTGVYEPVQKVSK